MNRPLISVCCITYNHQDYIEDCIKGFLKQEITYDVEFLIHDDASTDKTQSKIKSLVGDNPLFKLILRKENIKSTGVAIFPLLFKDAQGKYIAMCEGDDYWTDPLKLQKQVDFLEANVDYVVSCHNASIIDGKGILINKKKQPQSNKDRDYSSLDLQKGAFLLTLSMVFRNVIKEYPASFCKVLNGDTFLISLLGAYGKGRYLEDIKPAAYRVHSGGIWSKLDNLKRLKARRIFNEVLMLHYKNNAQLCSLFYQKQVNLSRILFRNIPSALTLKDYLDYNHFYIQHNNIFKSKYRLKEFLKFNWFYCRHKVKNLLH